MRKLSVALLGLALLGGCDVGSTPAGTGGADAAAGGGDGGGTGGDAASATPALAISASAAAITAEMYDSQKVTITVQGSGGFAGAVNLTASIVDAAGVPYTDVTVTLASPTVTLTADGVATVEATIATTNKFPVPATTLSLKIDAVAGAVTATLPANPSVNIDGQYTLRVANAGASCSFPAAPAGPLLVGTKMRFLNTSATIAVTIHTNGGAGIPHQNTAQTLAQNEAYERTATAVGNLIWYCHAPDTVINQTVNFIAP
jgi:hypothetical protein